MFRSFTKGFNLQLLGRRLRCNLPSRNVRRYILLTILIFGALIVFEIKVLQKDAQDRAAYTAFAKLQAALARDRARSISRTTWKVIHGEIIQRAPHNCGARCLFLSQIAYRLIIENKERKRYNLVINEDASYSEFWDTVAQGDTIKFTFLNRTPLPIEYFLDCACQGSPKGDDPFRFLVPDTVPMSPV